MNRRQRNDVVLISVIIGLVLLVFAGSLFSIRADAKKNEQLCLKHHNTLSYQYIDDRLYCRISAYELRAIKDSQYNK